MKQSITMPFISGAAMSVASVIGLFLCYFVLGLLTGIFGMCSFASEWWENIYVKGFFLIPVVAVIIGIVAGKRTYENQKFQ